MFQADVEAAAQKVDRSKSELQHAKFQRQPSEGLDTKGARTEEDAQKWAAQMDAGEAAVKEAEAEADRARLRYQSNVDSGNITIAKAYAELQQSRAALELALATVDSTKAQLELAQYYLDNTTMVAPEDGHIVNLQVQPGMVAGTVQVGGIASFTACQDI